MTEPLVTIGMPVYNCERTVEEAIASILNQTFADWELVVYDDGSRDGTAARARNFSDARIRVVNGGWNRGLPACLNRIVAACRSQYFARMDGDDIAYPRRLELQIEALTKNPGVDLLGGSIVIFDPSGAARGVRTAQTDHAAICGPPWRISNLAHVTWIGRTSWFRQHPYCEWATHAQDRELLTRLRRLATFGAIPDVVVGVRESLQPWKKLLPARKQMVITALKEGIRQRDPGLLLLTTGAELLKCGLDFAAVSTGLRYRLLKHRVPPISSELVNEWRQVLEQVQGTVLNERELSEAVPA